MYWQVCPISGWTDLAFPHDVPLWLADRAAWWWVQWIGSSFYIPALGEREETVWLLQHINPLPSLFDSQTQLLIFILVSHRCQTNLKLHVIQILDSITKTNWVHQFMYRLGGKQAGASFWDKYLNVMCFWVQQLAFGRVLWRWNNLEHF